MPHSARTIVKPDGTIIRVETDEEHYSDRPAAGVMHHDTEEYIYNEKNSDERII